MTKTSYAIACLFSKKLEDMNDTQTLNYLSLSLSLSPLSLKNVFNERTIDSRKPSPTQLGTKYSGEPTR